MHLKHKHMVQRQHQHKHGGDKWHLSPNVAPEWMGRASSHPSACLLSFRCGEKKGGGGRARPSMDSSLQIW